MICDCSKTLLTTFKLMPKKFPWNEANIFVILCKSPERLFYDTENKCFHPFWATLYTLRVIYLWSCSNDSCLGISEHDIDIENVFRPNFLSVCDKMKQFCGWKWVNRHLRIPWKAEPWPTFHTSAGGGGGWLAVLRCPSWHRSTGHPRHASSDLPMHKSLISARYAW